MMVWLGLLLVLEVLPQNHPLLPQPLEAARGDGLSPLAFLRFLEHLCGSAQVAPRCAPLSLCHCRRVAASCCFCACRPALG